MKLIIQLQDTTFSALVAIPAGQEAFFWLTYEQQLSRKEGKYKYKTNVRPYEPVDNLELKVNIVESRDIIKSKTVANFGDSNSRRKREAAGSFKEQINGPRSISYTFSDSNNPNEFQETIHLTYDIDRPTLSGGDLLVRDGHFVHFIRRG